MERINLAVTLADDPDTQHRFTVTNPAMVKFDLDRVKYKWPTHKEAPSLFVTYLAWSTMVELGMYPAMVEGKGSFPKFRDHDALHVEDDDDGEKVDPTEGESEPVSP